MTLSKNTRTCVDCGGPVKRWNAVRCHACKVVHQNPGYDVDPETGCHLYRGTLDRNGYGIAKVNGKTTTAHRARWERERGPLPAGTDLDHVKGRGCRYRHCCNLDHLEPVTHIVNLRRAGKSRLSDDDVQEIRETFAAGRCTIADIARMFNVDHSSVSRIVHRHAYRDL